jgi:N-acetylglucosaminyldiphosphoundecaprenol N-acetyl-beta-D-mannosaminyltransferase
MSIAETLIDRPLVCQPAAKLPAHVVMLTNFIPPYRLPVYTELAQRVEKLTILLSTPMEPNRQWQAQWGTLDVRVQRTWTARRRWRHSAGFSDTLHVHVPLDTVRQLRALRPDIILSAELGFRSLFSGIYARYFNPTPLVLWLTLSDHTEQGRGRLRQALRRWLLRRADTVVVNGGSGRRYIERFGFDGRRIFHVPYTALPDIFEQLPLTRPAESAHRLLYVGQLIERKGLVPFVQALASWAASHTHRFVEFDLAGSGPVRGEIEALRLPENLSLNWLGDCDYATLAQAYASAGIFAFPTLADEWGLVVNEAMSAGLPVLGSLYSQAVEELCREGVNGWTFHPDRSTEMLEAIDRAMSMSPAELDGLRASARGSAEPLTPRYAIDSLMPALEAALDQPKHTIGSAPAADWPRKLDLFGIGISPTTYAEAVEVILTAAEERRSAIVACQAVHAVVTAAGDPVLRERVNDFELVTPDGQPVRWAINWLHGAGLKERVYGPELMLRLCQEAARRGVGIYLYGGTPAVLDLLEERLKLACPKLAIAGREAPPFRPLTSEEDAAVIERINRSGAGLVFIGLGCPKQDHFAWEHRQTIEAVQVCVGAAFDFHAGVKPMAPAWMQRHGLEWLFRLSCEPRRLARRYLTTNTQFVGMFFKALGRKYVKRNSFRSK